MFLLVVSFVCAVPPMTTVNSFSQGYILKAPIQEFHKQNNAYTFNIHVFNISNGYPVTDANCTLHLYNSSGNHLWEANLSVVEYNFDYSFNVSGGNFSVLGEYHFIIQCYNPDHLTKTSSGFGGFIEDYFFVTKDGNGLPTSLSILYFASLLFLIVGLVLSIVGIINSKELLSKFSFICLTYLMLDLVSFVFYNVASNFVTNSDFLVSALWILWVVLTIGLFPFIIIGFVWCLITIAQSKEISDLIDKGIDPSEAEQRVKSKRKKW